MLMFMGLALMLSCAEKKEGSGTLTEAPKTTSEASPERVALDLSPYGNLDHIMVPARKRQGVDASVTVDDMSGHVLISAGKNFQIILREEPSTLEDVRQEMANELMWSNEIISSDDIGMLIKRSLPDGSMSQYHFAAVMEGASSNVLMRSDPMGEFSEKEASTMLACAKTLNLSSPMAINQ